MKILIIADAKIPIPPQLYGGAERIVAILAEQLQKAGHSVSLMAAPGSQRYGGRLFAHHPPGGDLLTRVVRKLVFQILSIQAAFGMNLVINFGRIDYLEAILRMNLPILCCFQNPVVQQEANWVLSRRRNCFRMVGVSHRQIHGLEPRERFRVIHNAADTEVLKFSAATDRSPYLAFLGRVTGNKGADTAISVAERTGLPLKLAGNISDEPGGREFFEKSIRPKLGANVEWLGPVNDEKKQNLLEGAMALLFPIRWDEPFGIVMVEALACGTPVIAMRCASTPEIIEPGVNGFLCDSEDEMVAAVSRIHEIDRNRCRQIAEERFSPKALVEGYLSVIEDLLAEAKA